MWVTSLGLAGEAGIFASLPFYPMFSGVPNGPLRLSPPQVHAAVHNSGNKFWLYELPRLPGAMAAGQFRCSRSGAPFRMPNPTQIRRWRYHRVWHETSTPLTNPRAALRSSIVSNRANGRHAGSGHPPRDRAVHPRPAEPLLRLYRPRPEHPVERLGTLSADVAGRLPRPHARGGRRGRHPAARR